MQNITILYAHILYLLEVQASTVVSLDATVVVVISEQSGSSFRSFALAALKKLLNDCSLLLLLIFTFIWFYGSDLASNGVSDPEGVFTNFYQNSNSGGASNITVDLSIIDCYNICGIFPKRQGVCIKIQMSEFEWCGVLNPNRAKAEGKNKASVLEALVCYDQ